MALNAPQWRDLPELYPGYRCSWQYFNSLSKNGEKDQLGTLNFLTPEGRRDAARGIRTGESVSLDLAIDFFKADISAFGGRPVPRHTLKKPISFCHEDHVEFNTQSSSQWDGFRHFGLRSNGVFYNGYIGEDFTRGDALGIQEWACNGGITGRGVLIDYKSWADERDIPYDAHGGTKITLQDIIDILTFQDTVVNPGDILIFRTGWLHWYNNTPKAERHDLLCVNTKPGEHHFIGLAQEERFVEWLWNSQIAAVAGDQVAFECTPPPDGGFGWLHEHLLAALGCPVGELWDTEKLAERCRHAGIYTFFLSSAPMVLDGGAASPANAVAVL